MRPGPIIAAVAAVAIAVAMFLWQQDRAGETRPHSVGSPQAGSDPPPVTAAERGDWFPDLQAPIAGPDAGTATFAGSERRFDCRPEDFYPDIDPDEERERMIRLRELLSRSDDAEHQLAAALLIDPTSDDSASRHDRYRRALALDPRNPLLLSRVAHSCRTGQGAEYCDDPRVQRHIDSVLGSNGWYWIQEADHLQEQGLADSALRALQAAAVAPNFDNYFIDYVSMFERALAAESDFSYVDRMIMGIGLAAALPGAYMTRPCRGNSERSAEWLSTCTAVAERFAVEGRTLINQMIGLGMLEELYAIAGRSEDADRAAAGSEALDRAIVTFNTSDLQVALFADEAIAAEYIEQFAVNGELAAMRNVEAAVERLTADPDYDPCSAVRDRAR